MNFLRHIRSVLIFTGCFLAVFLYEIYGHQYARNLILFFIWFASIMSMLIFIATNKKNDEDANKIREKVFNTYRDGKHLPPLMDKFFYFIVLATLVAYGWIPTAIAWLFIFIIDLFLRRKSKITLNSGGPQGNGGKG